MNNNTVYERVACIATFGCPPVSLFQHPDDAQHETVGFYVARLRDKDEDVPTTPMWPLYKARVNGGFIVNMPLLYFIKSEYEDIEHDVLLRMMNRVG